MKKGIYSTLSWSGVRKNKKMYLPYIFTSMAMVMMCYIMSFLSVSETVKSMRGGEMVQSFLQMGFQILCFFSLIFLFYTNSFLMRRRKKEFGLYNILGLGKRHLAVVLLLETVKIAVLTIVGGLFFGILFSKFSELLMIQILHGTVTFDFSVELSSVVVTILVFSGIHLLLYLNALRQIQLTNPIQLLHSEQVGEKPPKANWLVALAGLVLLAGAYYVAITIEDPITAVSIFFLAAAMVVAATYLLFVTGSVALCRLLQKNKNYYYRTNHFVSVSSMAYRMKRNGAGLASICILCTMVLVMISSTVCLYAGTEDSLRTRFPRNINVDVIASSVELLDSEWTEECQTVAHETLEECGETPKDVLNYRAMAFPGVLEGNEFIVEPDYFYNQMTQTSKLWQVFVVSLDDYNHLMGTEKTLDRGEAIIYTTKEAYKEPTIQLGDTLTLSVKERVDTFENNGVDASQVFPSIYLFVQDFEGVAASLMQNPTFQEEYKDAFHWYYGFDLDCNDDEQTAVYEKLSDALGTVNADLPNDQFFHVQTSAVAPERSNFYGIYGGLFFLGILLGIVFLFAAVLIIYYKQISEGYEDQSRFEIMQKVGMTQKEIKKSINSQLLTVFFLPLVMAGIHLGFAFPLIRKILMVFGLTNFPFLIAVTGCCYLVFALFYLLVYRITSGSYFSIVSGMRDRKTSAL